jgi:DNA repair protein RadA
LKTHICPTAIGEPPVAPDTPDGIRDQSGLNGDLITINLKRAIDISHHANLLTSGSAAIDTMLGGGFEEGKITEVFGASNSGKTQLAFQAAVMASTRGWKSVFVDTESTFRPERIEDIARARGLDAKAALESVFAVRARDVEDQVKVLARMSSDPRVNSAKLVIVDTVTKNFSLEFPERVGKRQSALGVYLNGVARDAFLHRRIAILTNRVASVTRGGETRDVNLGGLTLQRFVGKSVRLERRGSNVYANVVSGRDERKPIVLQIGERGFG